MSLVEQIPQILKHIKDNSEFIRYNEKIFNITEGDLASYAVEYLRETTVSKRALKESIQRLAPINILSRLLAKLTKIYSGEVIRTASSEKYQEVVDFYVKEFDLNQRFSQSNYFYNSTKVSAIEFFDYEQNPYLRVIPSHQFLMYSDNIIFPTMPTVYIKFMGEIYKDDKRRNTKRKVSLYFVYSDDEFLAIDSDGEIRSEYVGETMGINSYGTLPVVYVNKSDYLLIPKMDEDLSRMTILFVMLLTDLNYAVKYQAHSILYGINLELNNLDLNPDAFVDLKSDNTGKDPKIGMIKPEVDIQAVLNLIIAELDAWFESRNIKSSAAGKLNAGNFQSGVAMMIRELDTMEALHDQMKAFQKVESDFWWKLRDVHNYWVKSGIVRGLPLLGDDFAVVVEYEVPRPQEDDDKKLDRVLKALNKVMTLDQALKALYPDLPIEEIEKIKIQLSEGIEIEADDMNTEVVNAEERSIS